MNTRQIQGHHRGDESISRHQPFVNQFPSRFHPWIFIGGIPRQVNREEIFSYVKQFGKLKYFALPYNRDDKDNHKGFAKALFETPEDTHSFLSVVNHNINGVVIGVSEWVPKKDHISKKEVPSETKLFFKFRTPPTEKELLDYFSRFGKIRSIELKFNYKTNQIRDFGFVIFEKASTTQRVLTSGSQHLVEGKALLVFNSKTKKEFIKEKRTANVLQSKSAYPEDHQVVSTPQACSYPSQEAADFNNCNTCSIGSSSSFHQIKQSDQWPSKTETATRAVFFKQCFAKPTSKLWHHKQVNNRHHNQTILLFRQVVVRFPRQLN